MGNDGRSKPTAKQQSQANMQAGGQSPIVTSRSNYEIEQATMPFIDDADFYDDEVDYCKPATRLSQVDIRWKNGTAVVKRSLSRTMRKMLCCCACCRAKKTKER